MRFALKLAVLAVLMASPAVAHDDIVKEIEVKRKAIVTEFLPIHDSFTRIGHFNSLNIFLADQLERNLDRKSLSNMFIVTSFTNLDNLKESTTFGRLLSENLMHELQVRKWNVFDVRLTKDIIINESGEFSLSRDIKKIRDTYKIGGIVTGTYTVVNKSIIVNARVMDIETGLIVSSGQFAVPLNDETESLLFDKMSLKTMKIVGD